MPSEITEEATPLFRAASESPLGSPSAVQTEEAPAQRPLKRRRANFLGATPSPPRRRAAGDADTNPPDPDSIDAFFNDVSEEEEDNTGRRAGHAKDALDFGAGNEERPNEQRDSDSEDETERDITRIRRARAKVDIPLYVCN